MLACSDRALVAATACALSFAPSALATISSFDLFYNVYYRQTSDIAPVVPSSFAFAARIIATSPTDFASAVVTPPLGAPAFDLSGSDVVFVDFDFRSSLADLDVRHPAGLYAFRISGGLLGEQAGVLVRGPFFFTSDIPAFVAQTYSSMQNCDPAVAHQLRFNPFTPGPGAGVGLIFFVLFDDEDGSVVQVDQVPLTQTVAVIAPDILQPAHRYRATLYYSSRIERGSQGFGAANSIVGNDLITDFIFTTSASCPVDFNRDGVVDPDDLSDYLGCFFTPPCDGADYNNDAFVDPDDISDYIAAFFDGCELVLRNTPAEPSAPAGLVAPRANARPRPPANPRPDLPAPPRSKVRPPPPL